MSSRSTTEEMHLTRCLMVLYKDRKKNLHMVFIDVEKAYDRVPHYVLWECPEKKGLLTAYIRAIQHMCDGVKNER